MLPVPKIFPELKELENITRRFQKLKISFQRETLYTVEHKGYSFPIYGFVLGPLDPSVPTFGLFGGVHGLEKIGTHVISHYLRSLSYRLASNEFLRKKFQSIRFVSIPMVNPVGVYFGTRSNGNGVDLMRNGPTDAVGRVIPLASGHRVSNKLPWFRGKEGKLEPEAKVLIDFVREQMFQANFAQSIDVHSGFGSVDRLWHPYGRTTEDFPKLRDVRRFKRMMKLSNPYHIYKVEPTSDSYLIHGDLWDHIFDMHYNKYRDEKTYLPWTLEMGSWNWIKKNPFQIFRNAGLFHPHRPYRYKRTMRRHWWLLDFFTSQVANSKNH